jgi:putative flippase GtrA
MKKFLTIDFLKFCIIGVINTFIHLIIYNLVLSTYSGTISNTIAFIAASIFSYFANTIFTYKKKIMKTTFVLAMLVFLVKLGFSDGLEYLFTLILEKNELPNLIKLNPIFITVILTPLQFLVFNKIFEVQNEKNIKDHQV